VLLLLQDLHQEVEDEAVVVEEVALEAEVSYLSAH